MVGLTYENKKIDIHNYDEAQSLESLYINKNNDNFGACIVKVIKILAIE